MCIIVGYTLLAFISWCHIMIFPVTNYQEKKIFKFVLLLIKMVYCLANMLKTQVNTFSKVLEIIGNVSW